MVKSHLVLQVTMSGNAVTKIPKPELRGALIKHIKINMIGAFIGATIVTSTWSKFNQTQFYWQLQPKS
jgi:hypothetical protein